MSTRKNLAGIAPSQNPLPGREPPRSIRMHTLFQKVPGENAVWGCCGSSCLQMLHVVQANVWDVLCTLAALTGHGNVAKLRVVCFCYPTGASFSDVEQGAIGDCFFMGALSSMALSRKNFLRQAIVAYDVEVGVYGVMVCEEMHFRYVIVDDYLGMHGSHRFLYGTSANDKRELWVAILEKAYFKHMTCLEMCDGGWGPEVFFSFLGGVWGRYDVSAQAHSTWETMDYGHRHGHWDHQWPTEILFLSFFFRRGFFSSLFVSTPVMSFRPKRLFVVGGKIAIFISRFISIIQLSKFMTRSDHDDELHKAFQRQICQLGGR